MEGTCETCPNWKRLLRPRILTGRCQRFATGFTAGQPYAIAYGDGPGIVLTPGDFGCIMHPDNDAVGAWNQRR